jgi:hypothetical protein
MTGRTEPAWTCIKAAPIIGYMADKRRTVQWVRAYCAEKRWKLVEAITIFDPQTTKPTSAASHPERKNDNSSRKQG